MRTKTAGGSGRNLTADEMRKELALEIADARKRLAAARKVFNANFRDSSWHAIIWESEDVIAAEVECEVWREIEIVLDSGDPVEVLAKAIKDCRDAVEVVAKPEPFINAVLRAQSDANMRMAERLDVMKRLFERWRG